MTQQNDNRRMPYTDRIIERNGVKAYVAEESYFVPGFNPVLHFEERQWHEYGDVYPELSAEKVFTPEMEFCFPASGFYELFKDDSGEIIFRVFQSEKEERPILDLVFPRRDYYGISAAFLRGVL